MSGFKGLSDNQQALLYLLIVLGALSTWLGLGAPTDKASLVALGNTILVGFIGAIKEKLGAKPGLSAKPT